MCWLRRRCEPPRTLLGFLCLSQTRGRTLSRKQKKRERERCKQDVYHCWLQSFKSAHYTINLASYWYLAFSASQVLVTVSGSTDSPGRSEIPEQVEERQKDWCTRWDVPRLACTRLMVAPRVPAASWGWKELSQPRRLQEHWGACFGGNF